ncbi:MAG: hypothetical protein ACP6IS_10240 [Candidatus Asgardarchaeia archaeon]
MIHALYYIALLSISVSAMASFISFVSYLSRKLRAELYLSLLFLFLSVGTGLTTVGTILLDNLSLAQLLFRVGLSLSIFGFLIAFFFLLEFTSLTLLNKLSLVIISSLEGAALLSLNYYKEFSFIVYSNIGRQFPYFTSPVVPVSVLLLSFLCTLSLVNIFVKVFYGILKLFRNVKLASKVQILILFIGGLISFQSVSFVFILSLFISGAIAIQLMNLFLLIGVSLIAFAYFISPDVPYYMAVYPIEFYVLTESGIPIYNFRFIQRTKYDEMLVGGALLALVQFGREIFGSRRLNFIDWGTVKVYFEFRGKLIFTLFSMTYHPIIFNSLNVLSDKFIKMFGYDVEKYKNKLYVFRDADDIVASVFSFLEIPRRGNKEV